MTTAYIRKSDLYFRIRDILSEPKVCTSSSCCVRGRVASFFIDVTGIDKSRVGAEIMYQKVTSTFYYLLRNSLLSHGGLNKFVFHEYTRRICSDRDHAYPPAAAQRLWHRYLNYLSF